LHGIHRRAMLFNKLSNVNGVLIVHLR
jgi:hypothetical protein